MNLLKQDWLVVTSETKVTTGAPPPQLSLVVIPSTFGAGTSDAQVNVTFAGQVIVGGVLSNTTIVCVQVAELPQTSVDL